MQIHVVRPGQSLFGIAQAYNTTESELIRANELSAPGNLVVGQALVIPIVGRYVFVQPGDSLYTIARRFGMSAAELARINRIPLTQPLQVGTRLYVPPRPRRRGEFNAYVEPIGNVVTPALRQSTRNAAPHLTYLAPFSFQINRDGTLAPPNLDDFASIAGQNGVTMMLVVTNIEGGQFSTELAHVILTDEALQDRLLDNIMATARRLGFRDIHFDIERVDPADREAYNRFLRKAADRIHAAGYLISTALAPKTSAEQRGEWYTAHDYRAHGQIADFVVIMTYEWGYSGGPPMPVSPIGPVRRVLEYAISEIPAEKIMMGQNLYGYVWTLPYRRGTTARAISPQTAIDIARRENVAIQYDDRAQAPFFNYVDDAGRQHRVWFEDARSIQAKFDLVKELGLRGVSYWKLGLSFPQNWLLIEDNFDVVKR
ncbi:LysM peptidoglycan-binding domain-containing protein [Brevibacillus sp. SYP-B805]|uniref:glycoside hydrolase family 18 protein n=1 Tax=Brevibacillus sp. SYP-B805 TaxID=1578199 RepID=UPI0013EC297A|nr:glycoside hydrolase family 18 protein [Brevibacillus sp. SYP-B805]NGQ96244.1 LysM peptidoglycan-binding domain-containing protein [Brevibacillus sp. SYP-B805]